MRLSALLTAVTGLAVAGGSVYLARDVILSPPVAASASASAETVRVVVAARDIGFGEAIEASMLTSLAWPRDAVPQGIFSEYESLLPTPGAQPRRARRPISQGELLLQSKVSDFGEKVTIVQTLAPNTRAMAIKVDAGTAVGGFVTPGDRVDVVLTQGKNADLRAVTILQDIRVIGVDQESDQETDAVKIARTVTVEVSPEQGQRLALAQQAGTLRLTLRALEDDGVAPPATTAMHDLLIGPKPADPELAPKRTVIRVRRGTETTEAVVN